MDVYIVTTSCNFSPTSFPKDEYGYNVRIVTTDYAKAYETFDRWRERLNGHMERSGFSRRFEDDFVPGDWSANGHWLLHGRPDTYEHTNVKLEKHKVIE